jgi:hypothetical protein
MYLYFIIIYIIYFIYLKLYYSHIYTKICQIISSFQIPQLNFVCLFYSINLLKPSGNFTYDQV